VGLARPISSSGYRSFLRLRKGDGPHVVVNPDSRDDGEWTYEEGCLSVPGLIGDTRDNSVHLVGFDLDGNEIDVQTTSTKAAFSSTRWTTRRVLLIERLDADQRREQGDASSAKSRTLGFGSRRLHLLLVSRCVSLSSVRPRQRYRRFAHSLTPVTTSRWSSHRPDRNADVRPALAQSVKACAQELGLTVGHRLSDLEDVAVERGVVVAYGRLIPPRYLHGSRC